jgi:GNAT superfamily N-acetyltransferase
MKTPETELRIREFQPGDEDVFRRLNEEWITRYFVMEPKDKASLTDPRGTILDGGGRIFLAVWDSRPVGCCALLAIAPGEFEVAKMAVTESAQGRGIGRVLLEKVIAEARESGARRLYLETNRKLGIAIRLYESVGFRDLRPEKIVPSPYARVDVYMELLLGQTSVSRSVSKIS